MATDRKAALGSKTPAEFARHTGRDPKALRALLRRNGIRVSENPGAFNATVKRQLLDGKFGSTSKASAKPARKRKAKAQATPAPATAASE